MDKKRIIKKIREIGRLLNLRDSCEAKKKIPDRDRYDSLINLEIKNLGKIFLEVEGK